jgi:hypothetical protein
VRGPHGGRVACGSVGCMLGRRRQQVGAVCILISCLSHPASSPAGPPEASRGQRQAPAATRTRGPTGQPVAAPVAGWWCRGAASPAKRSSIGGRRGSRAGKQTTCWEPAAKARTAWASLPSLAAGPSLPQSWARRATDVPWWPDGSRRPAGAARDMQSSIPSMPMLVQAPRAPASVGAHLPSQRLLNLIPAPQPATVWLVVAGGCPLV